MIPPSVFHGMSVTEKNLLQSVTAFARTHLTLVRRSGESYAQHGMEVAATLREHALHPSLLAVAILHDILLHPAGQSLLARSPLLPAERRLVTQMYRLRRLHIDASANDLDAVIDAFMDEPKLLTLRMAHRLNDVRNLGRFSGKVRRQIARETLHMYTAIAGRLGMNAWRREMEDRCFEVVHPVIARRLESLQQRSSAFDDECLQLTSQYLLQSLRKNGIRCQVEARKKGLYSTYRKMILKNRTFHELTDRLALRVLVEDRMECYKALAVVHGCMHAMPGKLKDYIGAPKENGYQSIHTVVYPLPNITQQPIEIQIRTKAMQQFSEYGYSSHQEYKSAMYALSTGPSRVHLFRGLESLREESRSPGQFAEALRRYFREDQVAVFDPQNTLFYLRKPATALDFVCHAQPKRVGMLKHVRVNGRELPLDTELRDGDTVEVFFGRERSIHENWQRACRHPRARELVRSTFLL